MHLAQRRLRKFDGADHVIWIALHQDPRSLAIRCAVPALSPVSMATWTPRSRNGCRGSGARCSRDSDKVDDGPRQSPMIPRGCEQSRDSSLEERAAEIVLISTCRRKPGSLPTIVPWPRGPGRRKRGGAASCAVLIHD